MLSKVSRIFRGFFTRRGRVSLLGLGIICALFAAAFNLNSHPVLVEPPAVHAQLPSGNEPDPANASQPSITPKDQNVKFERLSIDQGLSQSVVMSILQDARGFMWFGTQDGLNRYDGSEFRVYKHDPENPHSLGENFVEALKQDQHGYIWIGTAGGLDRFDPETGQFTHYRADSMDPNSLSDNEVQTIYEDRSGTIWIGTCEGGLNQVIRTNSPSGQEIVQFMHYQHTPGDPFSLPNDDVQAIYEDREGEIWIGTNGGGLSRFVPPRADGLEAARFVHYQNDPDDPLSLSSNNVQVIYQDQEGVIWVGTDAGLDRFTFGDVHASVSVKEGISATDEVNFIHYRSEPDDPDSLIDNDVRTIFQDQDGVLWVGTDGGLERMVTGAQSEHFIHYQNVPTDPDSISSNVIRTIYQDREGVLWVGTFGGGVNKTGPGRDQFLHYKHNPGDPYSLSNDIVFPIYEDRSGRLWVGTYGGGLNRLDRQTGQFIRYQHDPDDPNSLINDDVWAIQQDQEGALWIGTSNGLDRLQPGESGSLDPGQVQFTHYQHDPDDPDSLIDNTVTAIHLDGEGALWLGTQSGLDKLMPGATVGTGEKSGPFKHYRSKAGDPNSLNSDVIWSIVEDRSGGLWIGTRGGGLSRFDRQAERFRTYLYDPEDASSLSNNVILSIYQDRSGVLWIGTTEGLNKYAPNQADGSSGVEVGFIRYNEEDGLPDDTIYGILEDQQGNLWLSTNRGLSRFDPRGGQFKNYDSSDGLQSNEFNMMAYFRGASGEMYFGGINGFNAFTPELITENPRVPPVVLTKLTQGGEAVALAQTPESMQTMTLEWPRNDFEFEFAALSFIQPEKNQHAYMLVGFDDDWNEIGTKRFGRYTNLPGGTYTLRIKGSNNDGVWNEQGASLTVTVVPPVWETWWFRGGVALVLLGGILVGYRQRLRSIHARSLELEEQVNNRAKELAVLNAMSAVVSRSLDLHQILTDALDKTLELMQIEVGGIYLLEEDTKLLKVAAVQGLSKEFVAEIDNLQVGEGFSGRVVQTGEPLVVRDVSADPRLTRLVVQEGGFHSLAVFPLVARRAVLGSLFVMTRRSREFSRQEMDLLTSIGEQIGVAISNARLFEAEQRRAEQFLVISEVGRRVASTLDIDEVLLQVVKLVEGTFGYYHVGIGLIEGDEVIYRVGAGSLWDDPEFQFKPARLKVGEEGISGWVAATGKPLIVPDVSQEPRYVWMRESRTRSELNVPIIVKGQVIGVLDVQSDRLNAFDQTDLIVLQSLANQAGAAIENARLYAKSQQAAVMEERNRLARELHDSVTQALYGMTLYAEAAAGQLNLGNLQRVAEHLQELQSTSKEALGEMRLLIYELRPPVLQEEGLVAALQARLLSVEGRIGMKTEFKVEVEGRLPAEIEEGFYRIAQEALNNTLKHAQARDVKVHLWRELDSGRVALEIADDGVGFDPAQARMGGGVGLSVMEERAEEMGASLVIESQPGAGTRVIVEVV